MEFGALPLRSFGDVVKQPAHGAVGALVIGPKDSKMCPTSVERATTRVALICKPRCATKQDKPLYRDAVLVLQDAVDARIEGNPLPNNAGAEEPDDTASKA